MKMSPQEMIDLALSGEDCDVSQELYSAFWNGYPIENLRPLLKSDNPSVLGLGSYLVYELEEKVRPLIDDVVPLLDNDRAQIRSDAIIALHACATKFDGHILGKIFLLLNDRDDFVQRGAMRFVQNCERTLLNVAVNKAAELQPDTVFAEFPKYVGKDFLNYRKITMRTLDTLLAHESDVAKRFAVGLAARPLPIVDESFLDLAVSYENEECRDILEFARRYPTPRGAVCLRM